MNIAFKWDIINAFVGVEYFHTNTRHALSPDGVAMLIVREAYWFKYTDFLN